MTKNKRGFEEAAGAFMIVFYPLVSSSSLSLLITPYPSLSLHDCLLPPCLILLLITLAPLSCSPHISYVAASSVADKAIIGGSLENDENLQKKQKTLAKLVITYTPQKILLRVRGEYISVLLINARFSATRFGPIPRKQSRICQVSVVFCFTSSIPLHSKINHLNANLQMERMAGQSGCRATTKREFKQNI